MQKYIILISLFFAFSITCIGQNNSIDNSKKTEKSINHDNKISFEPKGISSNLDYKKDELIYIDSSNTNMGINQIDLNIKVSKPNGYPTNNDLLNLRFPYSGDYDIFNNTKIGDKDWTTHSSHDTYLLIGSLSKIEASTSYSFNDNISASIRLYIAKYYIGNHVFGDGGVNMNLKYKLTDQLFINAFGQYSGHARQNKFDASSGIYGLYPTSYYGASLEYKVTKKVGIMGGIKREQNPFNGKWKNSFGFGPTF